MIEITEKEFDVQVLQGKTPVVVEFSAVWCVPCKKLESVLYKLSEAWQGKVQFFKVDVDDSPGIAMQYQVMSVPSLMLFINGEAKGRLSGLRSQAQIVEEFGPWLGI